MAEGKVRFAHVPKGKHASDSERASDWNLKRVVNSTARGLALQILRSSLAILWLHSSRSFAVSNLSAARWLSSPPSSSPL